MVRVRLTSSIVLIVLIAMYQHSIAEGKPYIRQKNIKLKSAVSVRTKQDHAGTHISRLAAETDHTA